MKGSDIAAMSWYTPGLTWLKDNTIFLTKSGSHAYGTNMEGSDVDVRGVAIPPQEVFLSAWDNFDQTVGKSKSVEIPAVEVLGEAAEMSARVWDCELDYQVQSIHKFFKLAADNNPSVLEILFTDEADWYRVTPVWHTVLAYRGNFLSTRVRHTFSGYAHSQLKRIETHRQWLLSPPTHEPTRADFGLPERRLIPKEQSGAATAVIQKVLDSAGGLGYDKVDQEAAFVDVGKELGMDTNFLLLLKREREYGQARKTWEQYQTWKKQRNSVRAALEAKNGYDTKHAMHLVRLYRMCEEILRTGQVNVKRPDAEELLAIRKGVWSYDELMAWVEGQEERVRAAKEVSTLPKSPNRPLLDKVLRKALHEFWEPGRCV